MAPRSNIRPLGLAETPPLTWLSESIGEPILRNLCDRRTLDLMDHYSAALSAVDVTGADLLETKARLARVGWRPFDAEKAAGGMDTEHPAAFLASFVNGYHDANYRDFGTLGHGRIIATSGSRAQRNEWLPKLCDGELAGLAMTEAGGGSSLRNIKTRATRRGESVTIVGEKTWVSRIEEASVFIVWAVLDGDLSAFLVPAESPNIHRQVLPPSGLGGWSWGRLNFDHVEVRRSNQLSPSVPGRQLLDGHFAHYRPFVGALALGVAAHAFDEVVLRLNCHDLDYPHHGGTGLSRVGETLLDVKTDLFFHISSLFTGPTCGKANPNTGWMSKMLKVRSVECAESAIRRLMTCLGAAGYVDNDPIRRSYADVTAFSFADGANAALKTAAIRELTAQHSPIPKSIPSPLRLHTA